MFPCENGTLSSSRASSTLVSRILKTNISTATGGRREEAGRVVYTGKFGSRSMVPFQRDMQSIILTETHSITPWQIWNACRAGSIPENMRSHFESREKRGSIPFGPSPHSGINQKREGNGTVRKQKLSGRSASQRFVENVDTVPSHLPDSGRTSDIAVVDAPAMRLRSVTKSLPNARFAELSSARVNTQKRSIEPEPALVHVVRSYEGGRADVYNLTVRDAPEFFANGVLVHNCVWGITELMQRLNKNRAGAQLW